MTTNRTDTTAALLALIRKDARRRNRRKALGEFFTAVVSDFLVALITGLWLMLAVGIVHHEWIRQCPTIGYWWAVALCALLRSALPNGARAKRGEDR